jgi:hypothetical protein
MRTPSLRPNNDSSTQPNISTNDFDVEFDVEFDVDFDVDLIF